MERKTILLVEDDVVIALNETNMLQFHGYDVISVNTGEDAVKTINKSIRVDLILMDINLGPGIDGIEAASLIMKKNKIPIIFLSNSVESITIIKECNLSCGFIVKTSNEMTLVSYIQNTLTKHSDDIRIIYLG